MLQKKAIRLPHNIFAEQRDHVTAFDQQRLSLASLDIRTMAYCDLRLAILHDPDQSFCGLVHDGNMAIFVTTNLCYLVTSINLRNPSFHN